MTVTKCDCCGRVIDREDGYIRLDMRRPVVIDSYNRVAVPCEYELCQLCGYHLEQELVKMSKEHREASK